MSQQQQAPKIHAQMTVGDILNLFPHKSQRLAQEITNAGLSCVGCHAATWETLEAGMLGHGKTREAIERLVTRLNALFEEKEETEPAAGVTITPKAAQKFLEAAAEEGKQGWSVRFGEEKKGCSGYEYILDFSEKASPNMDTIFESCGIQIHVETALLDRLSGSIIDFVEGPHGTGFKISNSKVKSRCGCGSSHSYKGNSCC